MLIIFFALLGAIIGSFLNVVIYRFNTGMGMGGRSKCFSCNTTLKSRDLIPVLSFLYSGGKCRYCGSKVSWQYISVEILTAILFAGVYMVNSNLLLVSPTSFIVSMIYGLVVMSLLVVITVYDFKHKIIPDAFSYAFAIITFIALFVGYNALGEISVVLPGFLSMATGVILAFPFYLLWLISEGRWMGLGDAKLALGIGWFLGLSQGASAIIFGFWIGAVFSVCLLLVDKYFKKKSHKHSFSMKSEIPFAPFLIAGLLLSYFFGYDIFVSVGYLL